MRTRIALSVTPADLDRLRALVKDRDAAQKYVWRAQVVLRRRGSWHERDHAEDRQVQNLRLAHPITISSGTFMPRQGGVPRASNPASISAFALGSDGLARGLNVW